MPGTGILKCCFRLNAIVISPLPDLEFIVKILARHCCSAKNRKYNAAMVSFLQVPFCPKLFWSVLYSSILPLYSVPAENVGRLSQKELVCSSNSSGAEMCQLVPSVVVTRRR